MNLLLVELLLPMVLVFALIIPFMFGIRASAIPFAAEITNGTSTVNTSFTAFYFSFDSSCIASHV